MEGYGTDVYIHLQTDPNKLFEGQFTAELRIRVWIDDFLSFARLYIENGIILQDKEHRQWMGHWQGTEDLFYLEIK